MKNTAKKQTQIFILLVAAVLSLVTMQFFVSDKALAGSINITEKIKDEIYSDNINFDEQTQPRSEEPLITYPTYMEAYYRGLITNMGMNYKNSCGYVAIGMLLSYYDSFLDDNIIPENYDVASVGDETNMIERSESPGIYNDFIDNAGSMTAQEYYGVIETMQEYSLHSKLMSIGKELGILKIDEEKQLGITTNQNRREILMTYLKNVAGITNYRIESASDVMGSYNLSTEDVMDYVRYHIDQGRPVLLSATKNLGDIGHVMICYKYSGSTFYGNLGWAGEPSNAHYNIRNKYSIFTDAMVLIFDDEKPHTHSNNYQVNHMGHIDTYCYCNSNIMTYTSKMQKFDKPACFNGEFKIPSWVTSIEETVFKENEDIKKITYEEDSHLSAIANEAFFCCYNLTTVALPKSVKSIGNAAFYNCTSLENVFLKVTAS